MENHNPGNSIDSRAMCQGVGSPMPREEMGTGPIRVHLDELDKLQSILNDAIYELSERIESVSLPEQTSAKESLNTEPAGCEVDAKILAISARTKALIDRVNEIRCRVMV